MVSIAQQSQPQMKRTICKRKKAIGKMADDLIKMMDVLNVDDDNKVSQETLNDALRDNDLIKLLHIVQYSKALPLTIQGFQLIGRYCSASTFSFLNSHPSFDELLVNKNGMTSIMEGIASIDNCDLLRYMTKTHHMRDMSLEALMHSVDVCIAQKAYCTFTVLCVYISEQNDHHTQPAFKHIIGRAVESCDNRIISISLGGLRKQQIAPMMIEYTP